MRDHSYLHQQYQLQEQRCGSRFPSRQLKRIIRIGCGLSLYYLIYIFSTLHLSLAEAPNSAEATWNGNSSSSFDGILGSKNSSNFSSTRDDAARLFNPSRVGKDGVVRSSPADLIPFLPALDILPGALQDSVGFTRQRLWTKTEVIQFVAEHINKVVQDIAIGKFISARIATMRNLEGPKPLVEKIQVLLDSIKVTPCAPTEDQLKPSLPSTNEAWSTAGASTDEATTRLGSPGSNEHSLVVPWNMFTGRVLYRLAVFVAFLSLTMLFLPCCCSRARVPNSSGRLTVILWIVGVLLVVMAGIVAPSVLLATVLRVFRCGLSHIEAASCQLSNFYSEVLGGFSPQTLTKSGHHISQQVSQNLESISGIIVVPPSRYHLIPLWQGTTKFMKTLGLLEFSTSTPQKALTCSPVELTFKPPQECPFRNSTLTDFSSDMFRPLAEVVGWINKNLASLNWDGLERITSTFDPDTVRQIGRFMTSAASWFFGVLTGLTICVTAGMLIWILLEIWATSRREIAAANPSTALICCLLVLAALLMLLSGVLVSLAGYTMIVLTRVATECKNQQNRTLLPLPNFVPIIQDSTPRQLQGSSNWLTGIKTTAIGGVESARAIETYFGSLFYIIASEALSIIAFTQQEFITGTPSFMKHACYGLVPDLKQVPDLLAMTASTVFTTSVIGLVAWVFLRRRGLPNFKRQRPPTEAVPVDQA